MELSHPENTCTYVYVYGPDVLRQRKIDAASFNSPHFQFTECGSL